MKKSLLVTIDFPPKLGGVARYWELLTELLPADRWQVLADVDGVKETKNVARGHFFYARFWPRWLKGVKTAYRFYRERGCEQIVAAQLLPVGAIAYVLHRLYQTPYIVQVYGMDLALASHSKRKRWFARKILSSASHVVVNSMATGKRLEAFGVHEYSVIYPIPHVDTNVSDKDKQSLQSRYHLAGKHVVVSVGRLVERKGHDKVIQALPDLIKTHKNLVYAVIGDGPHRSRLAQQAESLGVGGHVIFAGAVSHHERNAWLALSDMLIMPSRETASDVEGFGMVFLEAYAFGKPVVGGKSGGIAEAVLDGETGLLVDPLSVVDITKAIAKLLDDKVFAQQLGSRGRTLLSTTFSIESMRDAFVKLL